MKYRSTKQIDYDDDGAVETVKDSHKFSCQRGELAVMFSITAPEGFDVATVLVACKALGRKIESGNQIS